MSPRPSRPPIESPSRIRRRARSAELAIRAVPIFDGSFIVSADGAIEHASSESRAWLGVPGFEQAMGRFVASLARADDERTSEDPFEPYAEASAVRLLGADSPPRFHVRVRPRRRDVEAEGRATGRR